MKAHDILSLVCVTACAEAHLLLWKKKTRAVGYNVMREQLESTDPDWDKYVLFVAQDIDPLVCKMCYIQMCCIGVPGVVVVGNSLFPDAERAPTDFWFTHKYFALDEKAFENAYQQTKE